MKDRRIKTISIPFALAALLALASCTGGGTNNTASPSKSAAPTPYVSNSDMFSKRDLDPSYDASKAVSITLNGDQAQTTSNAVEFSGGNLTITDEGTYILSGTLNNGMIIVDADETDKIQLVLNGVSISAASSAAIYAPNADKVFITLADGSDNTLNGCDNYVQFDGNNIDAVVFAKCDLTLNGGGALNVQAPVGHGIVTKDDLVVASGYYNISAESHGLSGKDSIRVAGGSIAIDSGKDGFHSENSDDATRGFIYVSGGDFDINATGDGVSAGNYIIIDGGEFVVSAGAGNENAEAAENASCCGFKSDGNIELDGASFSIDSADDGLHSNADIDFKSGNLSIMTGDDALHADGNIIIVDGEVTIPVSHEGLEGHIVSISGGTINIVADDDGINAAGGKDSSGFGGHYGKGDNFSAANGASISISGGSLKIDSEGDGIDSNGGIAISGGETYISGSVQGDNSAMDCDGAAVISGGTFIATGASQMAVGFSSDSTQGSALINFETNDAGSPVVLADDSGNELLTWTPPKAFSCAVVSCPGLKVGSSYTLTVGGTAIDFTLDSIAYGSGGMGFPGAHGGPDGAHGNRPGGMGTPPSGDPGQNPGGMGTPPSGDPGQNPGGMGTPPSGNPGQNPGGMGTPPSGDPGQNPGGMGTPPPDMPCQGSGN